MLRAMHAKINWENGTIDNAQKGSEQKQIARRALRPASVKNVKIECSGCVRHMTSRPKVVSAIVNRETKIVVGIEDPKRHGP